MCVCTKYIYQSLILYKHIQTVWSTVQLIPDWKPSTMVVSPMSAIKLPVGYGCWGTGDLALATA